MEKTEEKTKKCPDKLWREYKLTGETARRNELIEIYLPLVRFTAEKIRVKLPHNVELDDLLSAGIFGLIDAIEGYDLERGVKFETYCATRIRGAILDELRSIDWVPRLVRLKAHKLEAAGNLLETELGRIPTDLEMAEKLGLTLQEFEDLVKETHAVTIVSLNESSDNGDSKPLQRIELLEDKRGVNPAECLHKKDVMEIVTKGLSQKERYILLLYYFEALTMKEIGMILERSESRICQLHARLLSRLQEQLAERRSDLMG